MEESVPVAYPHPTPFGGRPPHKGEGEDGAERLAGRNALPRFFLPTIVSRGLDPRGGRRAASAYGFAARDPRVKPAGSAVFLETAG